MDRLRQMQYGILRELMQAMNEIAQEMEIKITVVVRDPSLYKSLAKTPIPNVYIRAFEDGTTK